MLHVNGLTYRIGDRLLLDRASFAVPDGARVGLVGRNGAGKTTLFRIILGEVAPEGGDVSLPRLARIGSVAQEAPAGPERLIDVVLAADKERTRAPRRSGGGRRPAPGRDRDPTRRHRRARRAGAGRRHPARPRLRR